MVAEPPIWRDRLTEADGAQLGRGAGTISLSRPDILVVGGGIAGVATPAACHDAGLGSVLLIEAGRAGAGGPPRGGGAVPPGQNPNGRPPAPRRLGPRPPGLEEQRGPDRPGRAWA